MEYPMSNKSFIAQIFPCQIKASIWIKKNIEDLCPLHILFTVEFYTLSDFQAYNYSIHPLKVMQHNGTYDVRMKFF